MMPPPSRSLLGSDRGGEKAAVVLAHFLGDELVEQGVHAQDDIPILLRVDREIVLFARVVLEVEELKVVVAHNLLERFRRIEIGRRIIARELVLPVESEAEESPFAELGLQLRQRRRDLSLQQL